MTQRHWDAGRKSCSTAAVVSAMARASCLTNVGSSDRPSPRHRRIRAVTASRSLQVSPSAEICNRRGSSDSRLQPTPTPRRYKPLGSTAIAAKPAVLMLRMTHRAQSSRPISKSTDARSEDDLVDLGAGVGRQRNSPGAGALCQRSADHASRTRKPCPYLSEGEGAYYDVIALGSRRTLLGEWCRGAEETTRVPADDRRWPDQLGEG